MSAPASIISELEAAVSSGSSEKRLQTLRRVTDLFLNESERLSEQQVAVFDDVLVHLIQRIESKALVQLSNVLAPVGNAPIELIQRLARQDEIAVAGPILTQSSRLTEHDLIAIAQSQSQAHLLAISGRSSLTASVTDVLVDRGDQEVTYQLARNAGASFSPAGFATLVGKARQDDRLAERLGRRLDIPLQLLKQLLSRASDLVRSRILASASPEHQEQIQRALAAIVNEVTKEATGPRDFKEAEILVQQLNKDGKLNEKILAGFANVCRFDEVVATLSLFCAVPVELVDRIMKNINPDGVVTLCKAAKLSWLTAEAILRGRVNHHLTPPEEIEEAKRSFIVLSQSAAQRTIRFMLVQSAAKNVV